jgi:hypothetical protein
VNRRHGDRCQDGTYTATHPGSAAGTDGPCRQRAPDGRGGNQATDTATLTVDRGTTVAITGVEGGDNTINAAEAAGGIVITARLRRVRRFS